MFYLFIFIVSLLLISIVNALIHHLYNSWNFNKDFVTRHSTGRILNFENKTTKTQYGPAKSK